MNRRSLFTALFGGLLAPFLPKPKGTAKWMHYVGPEVSWRIGQEEKLWRSLKRIQEQQVSLESHFRLQAIRKELAEMDALK